MHVIIVPMPQSSLIALSPGIHCTQTSHRTTMVCTRTDPDNPIQNSCGGLPFTTATTTTVVVVVVAVATAAVSSPHLVLACLFNGGQCRGAQRNNFQRHRGRHYCTLTEFAKRATAKRIDGGQRLLGRRDHDQRVVTTGSTSMRLHTFQILNDNRHALIPFIAMPQTPTHSQTPRETSTVVHGTSCCMAGTTRNGGEPRGDLYPSWRSFLHFVVGLSAQTTV